MARVAFEPRGDDRVRAPVEVRGDDLALVARCVAGGAEVELGPGSYHAFATYPDGGVVHAAVTITTENEPTRVLLPQHRSWSAAAPVATRPGRRGPARASPRSPHAGTRPGGRGGGSWLPGARPFAAMLARLSILLGPKERAATRPRVRVWDGNPMFGVDGPVPAKLDRSGLLDPRPSPYVAQVEGDRGCINVLVPGRTALLLPEPGGRALPQPEFRDPDLAAAVSLYVRGLMREVATVAHGYTTAMRHSRHDAGRTESAAWAYLLLETGNVREADWLVMELRQAMTTPDEAVLLADLLSRRGHHEEALQTLVDVAVAGVPSFAAGVLLAVERLRLYAAAQDVDDHGEASRVLAVLHPFATALVPRAVLTTYGGANPAKPEPLSSLEEDPWTPIPRAG